MLEEKTAMSARTDGLVAGREASELLQAGLQKLSPELRETVILRDLEELEYREIRSVGTECAGRNSEIETKPRPGRASPSPAEADVMRRSSQQPVASSQPVPGLVLMLATGYWLLACCVMDDLRRHRNPCLPITRIIAHSRNLRMKVRDREPSVHV